MVGGVAIPVIFVWIIVRSTGAAHSGLPANTRRNADLFAGWVSRLGPSDSLPGSHHSSPRIIETRSFNLYNNKKDFYINHAGMNQDTRHHYHYRNARIISRITLTAATSSV